MLLSRRRLLPLPLTLLVPAALGGCDSAGLKDVFTARDSNGRLKTNVFKRDDTQVFLIAEFVSGRDDAILGISLYAPRGNTATFDSLEIAPGKGDHRIVVKLIVENEDGSQDDDGPWQPGHYEAELYIDDHYEKTVEFDVRNS